LILAQCYELVNDPQAAEKHFLEARAAHPDDLAMSRNVAAYYLRSDQTDKARAEIEKLVAASPKTRNDQAQIEWARRENARLMAFGATYDKVKEALAQFGDDPAKMTVADRIAAAEILANRPDVTSRREAIRLLESAANEGGLNDQAKFRLAVLYNLVGDWQRCRDQMLALLGDKDKPNPVQAGFLVQLLLEHEELDLAKLWFTKMQATSPGVPLTTGLQARFLVRDGKRDEAVAALRGLLPKPLAREHFARLIEVAKLLEELELYDAAEQTYREFVVLEPKSWYLLGQFLGRRGSIEAVLDLCEQSKPTAPIGQIVSVALAGLHAQKDKATDASFKQVETWLNEAIAQVGTDNPANADAESIRLRLQLAELYDLRGQYDELERVYREMLADPKITGQPRAIVLNNLAFHQAARGISGDGKDLIAQAIGILGPTSDLLDTRALVFLSHGETQPAIQDLVVALSDQPTGSKYFHLAQAYDLAGEAQPASDALRKAIDDFGLKPAELTVLEVPKLDQLKTKLGIQ
jgi:tetratricopeptide (TPR) repeat protein